MANDVAADRDALYYPYLHVQDANWLKATLLCFPKVYRVVPSGLQLQDPPDIVPFCRVNGRRGPLLDQASPWDSPSSITAQERLLAKLDTYKDLIRSNYGMEQAGQYAGKAGEFSFDVHYLKMLEPLTDFLFREQLVCETDRGNQWYALHPKLGNAILGTIAIAIAKAKGLAIVTDSRAVHYDVVTADEDQVFEALLEHEQPGSTPKRQQLAEELAEIIIVNSFNVDRLSAQDIADLSNRREDLQEFKNRLLVVSQTLPDIADPTERFQRLKQEAERLVKDFNKERKSRFWAVAEALGKTEEVKFPTMASGLITAGLLSANPIASPILLAAGGMLGVFLVVHQGRKIIKEFHKELAGEYPYLSRIRDRVGMLNLPPWNQARA
jgi:hypothetical protein